MTGENCDTDTDQRFAYRPAPLRAPVDVRVAAEDISVEGSWTLRLADVEAAAFVSQRLGDQRLLRLDLYSGGKCYPIGYSGGAAEKPVDGDMQQHLAAIVATLRALSRARPDARIALGAVGGARWGLFAVGLVSVLSGAGIATGALASGVSGERLVAVAVPVALLLMLGVALIHGFWPWRRRTEVCPAALADTLSGAAEPARPDRA